ncbi:hypothetical protein GCM10027447_16000 [Glycomyces halotolerans]
MKPGTKSMRARLLAMLAASAVAVIASLTLTSTPAQAHTLSSTVTNGCGSGYNYITGTLRAVRSTYSGSVYGHVGLAKGSGSSYCVFSYKSSSHEGHGVATQMDACYVYPAGVGDCDSGRFSHWAATKFSLGYGASVYYDSVIHHPTPGYQAVGGDSYTRPYPA